MSRIPTPGISANIANFVRQDVRIPKSKPLLPIFEAVSNSPDAIADREGKGTIRITVLRDSDLVDGERGLPHTFIVSDNGVGFTNENMEAFDELYSDHKMKTGGKGRGRFAFLKVFSEAKIYSSFDENGAFKPNFRLDSKVSS
jgi:Histidine kinase-, DNA gyrase B-, and HSP90-like ATPase